MIHMYAGLVLRVNGPDSTIDIRIVDLCPGCNAGDIDLSPKAFSSIADTTRGRVPISWHLIPCPVAGPIVYHFKEGSSQWWAGVQIRNHRYPVIRLEYLSTAGTFIEIPRESYNYFIKSDGLGPKPFTLRATDIYGHAVIDSGLVVKDSGDVAGSLQFPLCQ